MNILHVCDEAIDDFFEGESTFADIVVDDTTRVKLWVCGGNEVLGGGKLDFLIAETHILQEPTEHCPSGWSGASQVEIAVRWKNGMKYSRKPVGTWIGFTMSDAHSYGASLP